MKKIIFIVILFLMIFPLKAQGALLIGGDYFDTAVEMVPGIYESENMHGGQEEYFFVNLKPGQSLQIEANTMSKGAGIGGIILYNENRLSLFQKEELVQEGQSANFKISYLLNSEKDSWKLYIKKYCDLFNLNAFTIKISITDFYDISSKTDAPDVFEKAVEISYGKYNGYLSGEKGNDKKDFYKISIKEKGYLVLNLVPKTQKAKISAVIYDCGENIVSKKSSLNQSIRTSRYISEPGDYFIEIKGESEEIIPYEFELLSKEGVDQAGKKPFFETLNLKFIFGAILLVLILFIAGKIIRSLWRK